MGQPGVQGLPKLTMLLTDLDLPTTIDTSTGDMAAAFYEPALAAAAGYGMVRIMLENQHISTIFISK
jgi:hypothetical protein